MNRKAHICLDVYYSEQIATVACVGFEDWTDAEPAFQIVETIDGVAPYVSGKFFERELPCLLVAIDMVKCPIQTVVIDGNVRLDESGRPGLGQILYDRLGGKIPVVGAAKTEFAGLLSSQKVLRGNSIRPLYVTSAGISETSAAACIASMHGPHRMPTLLRLADQLSRGNTV